LKQRIEEHPLWVGVAQAFLSVLALMAVGAFVARPLGYPSAELCYALAGIGVAILLGYVIEAVWMVGLAKRDKGHENWLGFVCGLGLAGLLGIALALAVAAHRERGHGNLFDDIGAWWAISSLGLLGLLVVLHPFFVDRWRDD
jgi:hypothetical protein